MNKKFLSAGMIIPLAAAAVVSTAPSAAAAPRTDPLVRGVVRDVGICTGRSDVTLTARNARLRDQIVLTVRIVTNRAGQQWRVRITQNGQPLAARVAVTRPIIAQRPPVRPPLARRAELMVREVAADTRGVDRFTARATNINTGETCTAQVAVRDDRVVRPPIGDDRVVRPPIGDDRVVRPPVRPPFRP